MTFSLSKKEIVKEIVKSGKDPQYFINNYCRISHPMHGLIPFKTYPDQDDLINDFGLRDKIKGIDVRTLKWYEVLNAKGLRKRIQYLRNLMRDGNKLDDKPRIEVSTIHASKGGERDNVMLLTDLSYGPYKASTENQQGRDDEARVFYVGMTRAKQRLVIVRRTEAQYEYEPIFFYERKAS